MKEIHVILTNKTSQTIYMILSGPIAILPYEEINLSLSEYIRYTKQISNFYFDMKYNDEYEDILKQINNFSNRSIEYYILLNKNLTEVQKNTLLLAKEMV